MKKINVMGVTYSVKNRRILKDSQGELLGLCDATAKNIYIKTGQSKTERKNTIIHEIIHATIFELEEILCIKLSMKDEEAICRALAKVLVENNLV